MVLNELGGKISAAIRRMSNNTVPDETVLKQMLSEIARALLEADVNVRVVQQLRGNVLSAVDLSSLGAGVNKVKLIQKAVFDELCRMLDAGQKAVPLKRGHGSNVVMFVGLQGNGKTTTCAKFAYHYSRKGWKTCLVCADTFRAGAFDQLKQNATKAKIPFYGSYTETDPVAIATAGVQRFRADGYDLIVVDTSGRHKQEVALFEEMEQMASAVKPTSIVFVMDSSIGQAAHDQAAAFRSRVAVGSVIITKLDGHAKGGGALSAVAATQSPITFIGTGEHMDDFEPFVAERFVGRLLGMGDVSGLMTTMKDAGLANNADMVKRLTGGVFTLRDMSEQFEGIARMGPLDKVMGMIPGLSSMLPDGAVGNGSEGAKRIQAFGYIMDAMTDEELDNPKVVWCTSRIRRVARGSGRHVAEVEALLVEYRRFAKMVQSVGSMSKKGGMGGLGGMGGMGGPHMTRDMQTKMQQAMDPAMLRQMGGAGNMQEMLKRMMGSGGLPKMLG
ncbi:hypothetical protein MMPV_001815 [Pyropia vietnamensis]